jgi:hypothetical protein
VAKMKGFNALRITKLLNNNPVDRKTSSRSSRHAHRSVSTGYNAINVPIIKTIYYQ